MKKKYYALFSCDQHKTRSSMRLIGVFTLKRLRVVVRKKIRAKDFEYGRDIKEIADLDGNEIEKTLEFGSIQELSINEEL